MYASVVGAFGLVMYVIRRSSSKKSVNTEKFMEKEDVPLESIDIANKNVVCYSKCEVDSSFFQVMLEFFKKITDFRVYVYALAPVVFQSVGAVALVIFGFTRGVKPPLMVQYCIANPISWVFTKFFNIIGKLLVYLIDFTDLARIPTSLDVARAKIKYSYNLITLPPAKGNYPVLPGSPPASPQMTAMDNLNITEITDIDL